MKTIDILKYACNNYPVGCCIYSTSGNKTSHFTQTPYHIDEYGSVQDNYGWLIYNAYLDKWAEIKIENNNRYQRLLEFMKNNNPNINFGVVFTVFEGRKHRLWCGTEEKCMFRISLKESVAKAINELKV